MHPKFAWFSIPAAVALGFMLSPLLVSQPVTSPVNIIPVSANVGDKPGQVQLSTFSSGLESNMIVQWNGTDRATQGHPNPPDLSLSFNLTPADLAAPGLAELTLYSPTTGDVTGPLYFPVGVAASPVDAVYDPLRARFWLSIPTTSQSAAFPPNSVVAVDPTTGAAGPVLQLTAEPSYLAISDDGHYLYAVTAVSPNSVVRQFDLTTLTPVRQITYPASPFSGPIAVIPGTSESLLVADGSGQLAIYDQGVRRSKSQPTTQLTNYVIDTANQRIFTGAFCQLNCSATVTQFQYDSTGVVSSMKLGALGAPVALSGDLLYTTAGEVFLWKTGQRVGDFGQGGTAYLDPVLGRFFVLQELSLSSPTALNFLLSFDAASQFALGYIQTIPDSFLGDNFRSPSILVPFGADGFAFRAAGTFVMFHTGLRQPAPAFAANGVVNAASGAGGPIAPGEIVSIYGANLGPATGRGFQVARNGRVIQPFDVEVWFGNVKGTVLYASAELINVQVPFNISVGGNAQVQVLRNGIPSVQIPIATASAAPGLFQNPDGSAVALNADGTVNSKSNPAKAGGLVVLYGTGGGATPGSDPTLIAAAASDPPLSATVTADGEAIAAAYAGAAPGLVSGALQVNLLLPPGVTGTVPVQITIGGNSTQSGVTIAIR